MLEAMNDLRSRFRRSLALRLPVQQGRLGWDHERIAMHQRDRLRTLLAHAVAQSPFHARRLRGLRAASFELRELASLPIMSKADMMANFDEVITDRRLTLKGVEAHLESTTESPTLLDGGRFAITSGGTSGLKGVFVYDFDSMVDYLARVMIQSGPPTPGPLLLAIMASPSAAHVSGLMAALLETPQMQILRMPVTSSLSEMVRALNQGQPDVLLGYPSILRQLAHEQAEGRLSIRPKRVGVGSEQLEPGTEAEIRTAFGAPITNRFAASEGPVGACCDGENAFTFASDLTILECVDEHNRPVPPGTTSARVLVTNLYNPVQPLIRYALSDRLTPRPGAREHGHLRAEVDGRREAFTYDHTIVDSRIVLTQITRIPEIADWQVLQTPGGLDVRIVATGHFDRGALMTGLRKGLSESGLCNPTVSVTTVDCLDRDDRTGKVQRWLPIAPDRTSAP